MPMLNAHFTRDWSGKKIASLILSVLFVLLNMAYFSKMTFPVDEAKWLLLQVFAPALALYYTAAAILRHDKIVLKITAFQVCILLFLTWAAISGSWTLNRVSFPASLLDMTSLIIILVFFSVALRAPDQRLPIFFLGLFSTLVAAVGVMQYFGFDGDLYFQYAKPASFFVNKNYASPIVAASLPLLGLSLLGTPIDRRKLLLLAVFHLNFAYLLISGTKSSWFAYFGSMAVFTSTAFNITAYRQHFAKDFLLVKHLTLIASGITLSLVLAYIHKHGPFPAMSRDLLPQTGTILFLFGITAISPLLTAGLLKLWRCGTGRHRLLPPLVLLVLISGATIYLLSRPTPLLEQINTSLSVVTPTNAPMLTSWSARIPLWLNSLAIICDHPVLGVGLGSFDAAYPLYHKALMNDLVYTSLYWIGGAHNDLLQLLTELGLVGFGLIILCFVLISRYFHALMKTATPATALLLTGCYLGGVSLVLESLFNPVFHQPSTLMLLAFFVGVVHAALYQNEESIRPFIFRRAITQEKRFLYLVPMAAFFFLMLSVSTPWAIRRYQAFVKHKEAARYLNSKMEDSCYIKLREALNYWPYSSIIMEETSRASYLYLVRHFNNTNLQQAREYNRQALRALPYHFNTNLIRISLFKYLPDGRSMIDKYAPLLLKVTPSDKLEETRREVNF